MEGVSPKLPLEKNSTDGVYGLNKTLKESVKQNLKNLLLTSPGERIMDPTFGVGLRGYLFEQMLPSVFAEIRARINSQVREYLPFVEILDVTFQEGDPNRHDLDHRLAVRVVFSILPLNETDVLVINSDLN